MLGSFKEFFLLREAESDEERLANKYDEPFEKTLISLNERAVRTAFSEDDKNKCELFVKKGLDRDKSGEISWKELEVELTPKNIGLFCSSQGLGSNDFIIDLKNYLYFLAIKQNLSRANLLTKEGKLVRDTRFVKPENITIFYKKIYIYNGDKPVIDLAGENLRRPVEESANYYNVISEKKHPREKEGFEKKGENVGNNFPKGRFKFTEVGEKLNNIISLFKVNEKGKGIIFDKETLDKIRNFKIIDDLFNSKGINEASVNAIIKNPPKHNPFGGKEGSDKIAVETDEDRKEKAEKALAQADEAMKKKPSLVLKNGEADKFVDGDDVSVNGNDANGKAVGIYGFKIDLPSAEEVANGSTEEVFNKFITEVKEQLAQRLDKVMVEYLKTHFAKQQAFDMKEEKFLNTKFKNFKKYLLNEETDFVKNLQLTKEMINDPEARRAVIVKLVNSRFTDKDDEFKLSKESVDIAIEKFRKSNKKNRIAKYIDVQTKFRHFISMAASLLKKAKNEMDSSVASTPNNLDKVFKTIAEDLNKEKSDDIYKIARYVFVTIFNKFKGNKKYIAQIMKDEEAIKPIELLPKLDMGKDDAIFNCNPKNPKFNVNGAEIQTYWSDWVRITSFKQLFNENDIKYWTELGEEEVVEKFYETIETVPEIKNVFAKLTKEANNYISEYNNVSKVITKGDGKETPSTINLSTYKYMDEKETKNIALKQRLARYGLIQKEGNIYDIVYKDKIEEEVKKRKENAQQNQQQNVQPKQNNSVQNPEQAINTQPSVQNSQPAEGQANATVTTAAVDSTYPPSNPFKKRMREIIYRKGPYTIKVKD